MKSPFPGMDPYLERYWLDVHTSLVSSARDALNRSLPDDLVASAEERVAIEDEEGTVGTFVPDVSVVQAQPAARSEGLSGVVLDAPLRLLAQIEPATERFIRIVEAGSDRLVTVIEFVSPANKRGKGLHAFRSKRGELLAAGVHFVEIDLVRQGDWHALLRPHVCPVQAETLYRAAVRNANELKAVYLYPLPLGQLLMKIPIPLRPPDSEVRLDLQPLVEAAYVNGRYGRRLHYSDPLEPPLAGEDAAWTRNLLAAHPEH